MYSQSSICWSFPLLALSLWLATPAPAVIYNWQTGEVIAGTEGISPAPGVDLWGWSTDSHNLCYAGLSGTNLYGSSFADSWLNNASFAGSNLTNADLPFAVLTDADFTNAVIKGARFHGASGFVKEQLYSTASYQSKNLAGTDWGYQDLSGWDLHGQNLTGVSFFCATVRGADFADSVVKGADFYQVIGFTAGQLYSTSSYKTRDIGGIGLENSNVSGWSFRSQNLAGTYFDGATLAGADFTDSLAKGAGFGNTTSRGFTKEQLYSTTSYKGKDIGGIGLGWNDLSGWDFRGQDLTGADFWQSTLTNADFKGAVVKGATFGRMAPGGGITQAQLYSTASYASKDLSGISIGYSDLSGWDLRGQRLVGASLIYANLTGTDLKFADLRGTQIGGVTGTAIRHNTIWTGGGIWIDSSTPGLQLSGGEELTIRNYTEDSARTGEGAPPYNPVITTNGAWTMAHGSAFKMVLEGNWQSVMNANSTVDLAGTLNLSFAEGIDPTTLIGTEFKLFNWNGHLLAGDAFDTIASAPDATWDTSRLYTDGIVALTAVPEPLTLSLLAFGGLLVRRCRQRR